MLLNALIARKRLVTIIVAIVVLGFLLAATYTPEPSRDSGVFLYVGKQVLQGQIPYRDVWDHKPPIIFYLNAIALFIGRGAFQAIWLIEGVSILFAIFIGLRVLSKVFGFWPAILGSALWFLSFLVALQGGNFTEEYALPFQFLALLLFWRLEQQEDSSRWSWRGLLIGVTLAVNIMFKPNLIGIQMAIVLYLLWTRWRHPLRLLEPLLMIGVGAAITLGIVAIYFSLNHALPQLIDAVVTYNIYYVNVTFQDRINTLIEGLELLSMSGLALTGLAGWLLGVIRLWTERKAEQRNPLLTLALIGMPIELVLITASGRGYTHYYIALLPVFALLTAYLCAYIMDLTGLWDTTRLLPKSALPVGILVVVAALVGGMAVQPLFFLSRTVAAIHPGVRNQAADYVKGATSSGQYVLMWGAETVVNVLANRPSPTRFIYQYPLFTKGYERDALYQELLSDITTHKPALIIDASEGTGIPSLDPSQRQLDASSSEAVKQIFDYIDATYAPAETLPGSGWVVWKPK